MFRFNRLKEEDLKMVLRWRVQPEVTRHMYTDVPFDLARHREWFAKIKEDPSQFYWIACTQEKPIGLVSLTGMDWRHRRATMGYYIGDLSSWNLGGFLTPPFYDYCFARPDLKLNKIVAEVMAGNDNVMKLHQLQGYREVGVCRQHVFKGGQFHDVHLFELLKESWAKRSGSLARIPAKFED